VTARPRAIRSLAFRLDLGNATYNGVWMIDLEMFMGFNRGLDHTTQFFDRNYFVPRTTVVTRKLINWGPQGGSTPPGPNPFRPTMSVMLDAPWLFLGGPFALVWEVVIHSNAVSGGGPQDADMGSSTAGTGVITGTGCLATGQTIAMTHQASLVDVGGWLGLNITVTNGPANVGALLALGSRDPALQFPGLCSRLHTDLLLVIPIGATDVSGAITTATSGASSFVLRNVFGGGTLFTQVHAPDRGQPGLAIANSDGRSTAVPTPNLTRVVDVMRVWNNAGGTTAVEGFWGGSFSLGYALVTQFTY
jgi:hypothetical protein